MKLSTEDKVLLALVAFAFLSGSAWWGSTKRDLKQSLPDGARIPGRGDLHEVPAQRTSLDVNGFAALFNQAVQIVQSKGKLYEWLARKLDFDETPTPPEPRDAYLVPGNMFAAMAALETNNGLAVFHYNLGNVTTASGDFYLNPPSDTKHRYEVFLYPLQGAIAMVDRVRRLWPGAWSAAFAGDVNAFAVGLKSGQAQYFEAPAKAYAEGMRARAKQLGLKGIS